MKTVKEIIDQINAAKISSPRHIEDAIGMEGVVKVATVDREEHRWFVVGTVVYKFGDDFFGVNGPISLKSESMGYTDVGMDCEAFEMVAVPSVTYKAKA